MSEVDQPAGAVNLSLSLLDIDVASVDIEAIAAGTAKAAQVLGEGDLHVVVSGDFEGYVREHAPADPDVPPYVQARLRGQASGMLFEHRDGKVDLLVDASVVARDRDEDEMPERTFAHEALHLVLRRRGESTGGRRERMGHTCGSGEGVFAGMAGQAGEEYRVERALREMGYPLPAAYGEELPGMASDYARTMDEPFWEYQTGLGFDALIELLRPAVEGFEQLVPIVAYIVGDDVATGVYDPPPAAHGPARWVRAGYEALYEPLSELPSAATSCPLDGLDALLDPVERALTDWFASVGFRWSGGPVHFDVRLTDPARLAREIDLGHEGT